MHFHTAGGCKLLFIVTLQIIYGYFPIAQTFIVFLLYFVFFVVSNLIMCLLFRWTLPEIRDCLEEAGFQSVHFWVRAMPDSSEITRTEGFGVAKDVKYEETTSFQQQDSWNAYIVGVA